MTALIGPSGCGKSTFLRTLNRMHELVPTATFGGEVLLDGRDIYAPGLTLADARKQVGMVFQRPNPFPAMTVYDNVVAGLRLTGMKSTSAERDALVEESLDQGRSVDRGEGSAAPAGGCAVRRPAAAPVHRPVAGGPAASAADGRAVLGPRPDVDRSDRGDHRRDLGGGDDRHRDPQHASGSTGLDDFCAFFLADHETPGVIVEAGPTRELFESPTDPRTEDYVHGRFG